eukprot:CAMPEP_0182515884 /NCGR_PEP_ID=MMETSP1321-20130603/39113_1 /TAXON_ID=91990 /ORGANISM="Bolidomonas sp., Strain RCC1657" /LENGTH=214 /DNA_ID=CAMNT_0024723381 /DNA_START=58 /DNA_END=698 /DNA_ORIENTATION=+
MASLIYTHSPSLFTVNVCEATPPSTKYNIPSGFGEEVGDDSKAFGTTTRDEYGSYLGLNNISHLDPTSTSYTITCDNKGSKTFDPIRKIEEGDPASSKTYRISEKAKLTNMSKSERWEKEKKVKDNLGPGLYFLNSSIPFPSKPSTLSYTFRKTPAPSLGKGSLKIPGPGTYEPKVNSKGVKAIGCNRLNASMSMEKILSSRKGYKCRGFGVRP